VGETTRAVRSLPRAVARGLVLVLVALGLVVGVTPARQAQALGPAVVFVAPTVARTVLLPIAAAGCGSACRGKLAVAAGGYAGTAASALCLFVTETCTLNFQQNPQVPPNSDQTPVGPSLTARCKTGTTDCVQSQGYHGVFTYKGSALANGKTIATFRLSDDGVTCNSGSKFCFGIQTFKADGTLLATYGSGYQPGASYNVDATGATKWGLAWFGGAANQVEPVPGTRVALELLPPDPSRTTQAFKRCIDGSTGVVSYIAGEVATYREGEAERPVQTPACPAGHYAAGGGLVQGNPWSPGQVIGTPGVGAPAPAGTPVTPDVQLQPEVLPKAPATPAGPTRTQPGTPADPLPEVGPDGTPTGNPQPLPPPYVDPDTGSEEGPCMWGGYAVAPEDCEGAPEPSQPTPNPSTAPSPGTGSGPSPQPSSAPGGFPTSGTNPQRPEAEGCIDEAWSWNPVDWVFVPAKCALRWAFVPSAAT
jgi:hypothetical protein